MTISKCEELNEFIKKNNPDIISLNEVKMNQEESNYYLNFNNYKTYYKPRVKNSRFGGGVALIIKKSIEHTESNILDHLNIETKEIKISTSNCNFTIVTYYNPPNTPLSQELFATMNNSNLDYIICGDLNAKSAASKNGEILDSIIANYNCQIINNNQHTFHRIYNDYTQILDLIICSPAPTCKLISFEVLTEQELTSDHYPICAVFDLLPKKKKKNYK